MKLILLSDLHLINENPVGRLDDLTEVQWNKLNFIFEYARSSYIQNILQAGDLTDIRRSWGLLQRITMFLQSWQRRGVRMYGIKGQHDSYYHDMSNDKTILGVLMTSKLVTRLTSCPIIIEGEQVYGCSYGEETPKIDGYRKNAVKILVIHKQIINQKLWAQQTDYDLAEKFLKEQSDYDLILVGDPHQKYLIKDGKRFILNTGVMLRLESSEQMFNHEPCFAVYDTEKRSVEWVEIPHKKGKLVLSKEHLIRSKQRKENFDSFIDKVQEIRDGEEKNAVSFEKNLEIVMRKGKTKPEVKKIVSQYLEGSDKE